MKILKLSLTHLAAPSGGTFTLDLTAEPHLSASLIPASLPPGTLERVIAFALYDDAPAPCLPEGAKQGAATLLFLTAEGETWEAELLLRRKGTDLQAERRLRRLAPKKESVSEDDRARRVREILLPSARDLRQALQASLGSLETLLRAHETERPALLETLTGTETYSRISRQVDECARNARAAVSALESEIQGMRHDRLCPEALAEERERLGLLNSRRRQQLDDIRRLEGRQAWFHRFDLAAAEVKQAEADEAEAARRFIEMRGAELRLARYDAVLPMQPLYQEIIMRRRDIERLKQAAELAATRCVALRKSLDGCHARLDTACERTAAAEKQHALRRAAISRSHVLAGEIAVNTDYLKRLDDRLAQAQQTLDDRTAILAAKQGQFDEACQGIEKLSLLRQSLSVHHLMFDKYDLVKDKLGLLRAETLHNEKSHKELAEKTKRLDELNASGEKAEKQQHDQEARLDALKSELLIHRQAVQGQDSASLQHRAADAATRLAALRHAAALWGHISAGHAVLATRLAAQKREQVELQQKRVEKARNEAELQGLLEALGRITTTYTLSNAENISTQRSLLKEGCACPVCGATHHPYHTETEREKGELLSSLAREHAELSERVEAKREVISSLRETIAADIARIEAGSQALAEGEERLRADIEEWGQCAYLDPSFSDCSATVNRDARRLMIELLVDNTTRAVTETERELAAYNSHQLRINKLNEDIAEMANVMANNRAYLENLRMECHLARAAAEDLRKVIALSERSCSELYTDLDEMVTLSGWFTEWKNNPDNFRMRLTFIYEEWNRTLTALDKELRARDLLQEEIKGAENNLAEARRQVAAARDVRDATREQLTGKQEELRRLLGDRTVQKETELLEKAVDAAREAEAHEREAYGQAAGELRLFEGQSDSLETQLAACRDDYQARMQQLDLCILKFNGANSPVQFAELERIFSDATDWGTLRAEIDRRREDLALARFRLGKMRSRLLAVQAETDRPESTDEAARTEIAGSLAERRGQLGEVEAALGEAEARLRSHENCERNVARVQSALESARAEAAEWEQLDAFIGSPDGSRFRLRLQARLLARLLSAANVHLEHLAPRFGFRVPQPASFAIEVLDRDRLDSPLPLAGLAPRDLTLLSFALAAALASLTSGEAAPATFFAPLAEEMEEVERWARAMGVKVVVG